MAVENGNAFDSVFNHDFEFTESLEREVKLIGLLIVVVDHFEPELTEPDRMFGENQGGSVVLVVIEVLRVIILGKITIGQLIDEFEEESAGQ